MSSSGQNRTLKEVFTPATGLTPKTCGLTFVAAAAGAASAIIVCKSRSILSSRNQRAELAQLARVAQVGWNVCPVDVFSSVFSFFTSFSLKLARLAIKVTSTLWVNIF